MTAHPLMPRIPHRARCLLLLPFVAFLQCSEVHAGRPGLLTWSPPKLDSPKTIRLTDGDDALDLDSNQDYMLQMPARKKAGHVRITGGRNVVLIGGWSTMPAGRERGEVNFLIQDKPDTVPGRIVHIEGVKIDGSGGGSSDAFRINASKSIVQLENIRATGIVFDPKIRQHSDLVQTAGGCLELRIDRFTGSSQFQGFYLAQDKGPNGRLDLRHVNLRGDGARKIILLAIGGAINSPKVNGKRMFDLCDVPPVNLVDVYLKPSLPEDPTASVLPNGGARNPACQAKVSVNGKTMDWPDRRNRVTGSVQLGEPPDGDFVPEGSVGLNYGSSRQAGESR
jgi:hypothetical protein